MANGSEIQLLDHIIITSESYYSFADEGDHLNLQNKRIRIASCKSIHIDLQ
ncbi:MAG: JAB domain-containing protein [Cytophagales bacterium]|nr:JAB domain-containing protein [Cytophagales bacterium]